MKFMNQALPYMQGNLMQSSERPQTNAIKGYNRCALTKLQSNEMNQA